MKIAVASDLHLEFRDLTLNNDENADVLVLAGDICVAKHFHSRPEYNIKYFNFFKDVSTKFKHVIYVVGNHEHYNHLFNDTVKVLKDNFWGNIHILDNETFEIDNKTFVGATLWTDMNNNDPLTLESAKWGMNDFRIIKYTDGVNYFKFKPEQSVIEHNRSRDYIKHVIRNCNDRDNYLERDVIVVTHHAPSPRSSHPRFAGDLLNGAFHSDLEHMMEMADNVKLWIHGHTHDPYDYKIGITNVVCNPRGYPSEHGHDMFKLKYLEV